jgi:hypothetical protein
MKCDNVSPLNMFSGEVGKFRSILPSGTLVDAANAESFASKPMDKISANRLDPNVPVPLLSVLVVDELRNPGVPLVPAYEATVEAIDHRLKKPLTVGMGDPTKTPPGKADPKLLKRYRFGAPEPAKPPLLYVFSCGLTSLQIGHVVHVGQSTKNSMSNGVVPVHVIVVPHDVATLTSATGKLNSVQ